MVKSLLKKSFKRLCIVSGIEKDSVNLLSEFYDFYGHRCKYQLVLLFFGAILSGLIEICGLVALYIVIRLLIDIKSFGEDHIILQTFSVVGIENRDSMIPIFGALILVVFIFKNIYSLFYYNLQHLILRRWKNGISNYLMSRYLHAPYFFLLKYNTATIIRNVNKTVSSALNGFVLSALNYGSNLITGLIILSLLCFKYFTVTVIIGVVLAVTTYLQTVFLKQKQLQLGKEREQLDMEQTRSVYQGLHAVKETKVVGKENYFLSMFKKINTQSIDNEMKTLFYGRLPAHLTEITVIIAVLMITVAVLMDTAGNLALSMSSLAVLGGIAFRLSPIMNRTISSLQAMNRNKHSMINLFREIERMKDFKMRYTPREEIPTMPFEKSIELKKVSLKYHRMKTYALRKVDLSIKKGEFVGIVGTSGSGKTTMVDIILGLLEPKMGEVYIDDVLLTDDNMSSWQKNIGYVPQSVYMGEGSIAENIAFGIKKNKIDWDRINKVVEDVKLTDFVESRDEGIEYDVGENGKHLSGGQKQRLGIARALYLQAQVLVLDEATSALDVPTEVEISTAINSIRNDKTIIVIAHRLSTVMDADKIVFMEDGQILDVGSYKELYERSEKFNSLAKMAKVLPTENSLS